MIVAAKKGQLTHFVGPGVWADFKCGRHSGFPWCCIVWYVWPYTRLGGHRLSGNRYIWKMRYAAWRAEGDYIECPFCKLRGRKPAPMRPCRCRPPSPDKRRLMWGGVA